MFVVNTTSATVGGASVTSEPRKRVPSSRRRNPGRRTGISFTRSLLLLASSGWRRALVRWSDWHHGLRRRSGDRRRSSCRATRQSLIKDRRRRATTSRHQLEHEGDTEEETAGPPRDLRKDVSGLTCSDK